MKFLFLASASFGLAVAQSNQTVLNNCQSCLATPQKRFCGKTLECVQDAPGACPGFCGTEVCDFANKREKCEDLASILGKISVRHNNSNFQN